MEDIASDMSAIHRVWIAPECNDYGNLTGPRFLSLANRLRHYPGILRDKTMAQLATAQEHTESTGTDVTPDMLAGGMLAGTVKYEREEVKL